MKTKIAILTKAESSPEKDMFVAAIKQSDDFGVCIVNSGKDVPQDCKNLIVFGGDGIGEEKTKNMHVHFSKIMYGAKGEIKHLTFADNIYGPEFEPLCEVIVKNNLTPHVLSESAGTQMFDSLYMKEKYESMMQN